MTKLTRYMTVLVVLCLTTAVAAPGPSRPREDEARAAILRKDFAAAERIYQQLANLEPKNLDYAAALARLRSWQGDLAGARARYDAVLRNNPMYYDALVGKAQLCLWQGRLEEAEDLLYRAELAAEPNVELHLAWARLHRAYGKRQRKEFEARARKALALEPSNAEAGQLLEQAREMSGIGPMQVRLSYGQDHFSHSPVGRMGAVSVGWRGETSALHALFEQWDRFGEMSSRAGAAYSFALAKAWRIRGIHLLSDSVSGILPKHDHTIGLFRPANSRMAAGLDYRYLQFPDVRLNVLAPTMEFYFSPKTSIEGTFFASFQRHRIALERNSFHATVQTIANFQARRWLQISSGYSRGNQGYLAYTSDRLQSFNSNVFLGRALVRITPSITAGLSYALEHRSNHTYQQGFGAHVTFR